MKRMQMRICAFLLAAVMLAGVLPTFSRPVHAEDAAETEKAETAAKAEDAKKEDAKKEEKPAGKLLFNWNCNYLDPSVTAVSGNKYPDYYFADLTTQGVEKGTVYMGGEKGGRYATMTITSPRAMTDAACTIDIDMKIDALLTPMANLMFRGFVMEFELPDNKLVYIVLQDMGEPDEDGKNATLRVSKMERGSDVAYVERIAIPTDDAFHKWTFQYDGVSMLRVSIDGELVKDFPEVDGYHEGTGGKFLFKNIMMEMTEDSTGNSVTFDNIKVTEGTVLDYSKIETVAVASDATAGKFTVTPKLNRLVEEAELSLSVYPRGDKEKAVTVDLTPEDVAVPVTLTDIPFTGLCTVEVNYADALPYTFDYWLYKDVKNVSADEEIKAEDAGVAYLFNDLEKVKIADGSEWYTVQYETGSSKGAALCIQPSETVEELTVPVTLTGKYAVYAGYMEGSRGITLNGTEADLGTAKASTNIVEAFITVLDADGAGITLENIPLKTAQIAYLKFVSLTDELYEIAVKEDDSHTFITDNDGYSTLCNTRNGNYESLYSEDFSQPYSYIDQRQFIWCTFSTSILNYNSEAWWKHVEARLKELNIPEGKWPKDFLDHVNTEGEHLEFDEIMRNLDKNAYANMRALNEIGYPHKVLSDMMAEQIEDGQFYVSLRMSHFMGTDYAFMTGSLYHLHPEWVREGGGQLSYYHEGYRAYLHDILVEMAQPENVTGILMDFGRYYWIFGDEVKDVAERTKIMNEFVKSVHDDLPKGKKLTVRVLDPVQELALGWGLNYKDWVENGWVDRVYISAQGHETFFDFDEYIAYFDEHPEVEFYLGVNATLSGHDLTKAEEDLLAAGGSVRGGESVDAMDIMLRIYDFYAAGADGVFTFNWSGTDAMFKNVQNATRMMKWYNFIYPTSLVQPQPAKVTDPGGKRVIFQYDCDSLASPIVKRGENKYPEYYIADHAMDAAVPEGQLYIGGEAKNAQRYASLLIPTNGVGTSYTLSMDLKIESLMIPAKLPTWRGLVFEIVTPGAPLLYFVLNGMEKDAAGNNAVIHLSQKSRAGDDIVQKIQLPADDKFHTWTVDFDGKGAAVFKIDGKEILKAEDIVAEPTKEGLSQLEIRNVMMDIASGHNAVYVDNVSMISEVGPTVIDPFAEKPKEEAPAVAEEKAAVTVDVRAEVLALPVSDGDWEKALTVANSDKAGNYKTFGKTAEVEYAFDAEAKKLRVDVNFNLNSWLFDFMVVDGEGKIVEIKTDRQWGKTGNDYTLWSHQYADNGHAAAIKTMTFTVNNVTELPDKYVVFASNCGTSNTYTAKITIDFP